MVTGIRLPYSWLAFSGVLWVAAAIFLVSMSSVPTFASHSFTNDTDTAGVSVTINNQTIINIVPTNWTLSVGPGGEAINTTFNFENLGSANITLIWASTSQPTSDPFGGPASGFNAGNYLAIGNYSLAGVAQVRPFLVDAIEFNYTVPSYVTKHADCAGGPAGKIRNASREYFWCSTDDGVAGAVNFTNDTIIIGNAFHSDTQLGTVDLRAGGDITQITLSNDQVGFIPVAHALGPACIRVRNTTATSYNVRYFRWNADIEGDCVTNGASPYIFRPDGGNQFAPGNTLRFDLAFFAPYGSAAGSMTMGLLTISAQS